MLYRPRRSSLARATIAPRDGLFRRDQGEGFIDVPTCQKKLSKAVCDAAAKEAAAYRVTDSECPGLALRVTPNGNKTFYFVGRLAGRRVDHRLGAWPTITVAEARDMVIDLRRGSTFGRDPTKPGVPPRFSDLMDYHLAYLKQGNRRPNTIKHQTFYGEKLKKALGMIDVRAATLADWKAGIEKVAQGRDGTRYACTSILSRCLGHAADAELIARVPKLELRPAQPRSRFLSIDELVALWPHASLFIRFLIVIPARRDEARLLDWREIDMDKATWVLPSERSKNHTAWTVPLPPLAMAILRDLKPQSSGIVFKGQMKDSHRDRTTDIRSAIKKSGMKHMSHHDLRRTFATLAAEHGLGSLDVIDALLNHRRSATLGGVLRHYSHATLAGRMKEVMLAWDAFLTQHVVNAPPIKEAAE